MTEEKKDQKLKDVLDSDGWNNKKYIKTLRENLKDLIREGYLESCIDNKIKEVFCTPVVDEELLSKVQLDMPYYIKDLVMTALNGAYYINFDTISESNRTKVIDEYIKSEELRIQQEGAKEIKSDIGDSELRFRCLNLVLNNDPSVTNGRLDVEQALRKSLILAKFIQEGVYT